MKYRVKLVAFVGARRESGFEISNVLVRKARTNWLNHILHVFFLHLGMVYRTGFWAASANSAEGQLCTLQEMVAAKCEFCISGATGIKNTPIGYVGRPHASVQSNELDDISTPKRTIRYRQGIDLGVCWCSTGEGTQYAWCEGRGEP